MRALLAAVLLLLTSGCVSTPLATNPGLAPSDSIAAPSDAAPADIPGSLLLPDSSSSSAFRIWRGHDAHYELFANEEPIRLRVDLAPSAYALLELDGPAACDDTDLGTGAAAVSPAETTMEIDCGVLPLGWYRVQLSVGGGLARGSLSSTGGHLRPLDVEE